MHANSIQQTVSVTESLIEALASEMLRQCKSNATSQNENPNIISRPNTKVDNDGPDENAKKNNNFQNSSEKSPFLE